MRRTIYMPRVLRLRAMAYQHVFLSSLVVHCLSPFLWFAFFSRFLLTFITHCAILKSQEWARARTFLAEYLVSLIRFKQVLTYNAGKKRHEKSRNTRKHNIRSFDKFFNKTRNAYCQVFVRALKVNFFSCFMRRRIEISNSWFP